MDKVTPCMRCGCRVITTVVSASGYRRRCTFCSWHQDWQPDQASADHDWNTHLKRGVGDDIHPSAEGTAQLAELLKDLVSAGIPQETREVLEEVARERRRQDERWGGPAHDDEHTTLQFLRFISNRGLRVLGAIDAGDQADAERRLIQVAALAVAAVESSRRRRQRAAP